MKIHEAVVTYPEQGGILEVPLPSVPSDTSAVDGSIQRVFTAGPGEPPMIDYLPATVRGVGPGSDGGGTWAVFFDCSVAPPPGPGSFEVRAFVHTNW